MKSEAVNLSHIYPNSHLQGNLIYIQLEMSQIVNFSVTLYIHLEMQHIFPNSHFDDNLIHIQLEMSHIFPNSNFQTNLIMFHNNSCQCIVTYM